MKWMNEVYVNSINKYIISSSWVLCDSAWKNTVKFCKECTVFFAWENTVFPYKTVVSMKNMHKGILNEEK